MANFDLTGLKKKFKTVLAAANTTTASIDLSGNMTKRVAQVTTFNPDKVFHQADLFPSLNVFTDNKDLTGSDIVKNQAVAKRRGEITLNILGAYQDFAVQDDNTNDEAADQLELMMENCEDILRNDPTLGNFSGLRFQIPNGIQYAISTFDEEVYFRAAIMSLKAVVIY